MRFMNWIIEELNGVSDLFYSIYLEVHDWPWPFWLASSFFYSLCTVFNWLAWDFSSFAEWVYDVAARVAAILDWDTIWGYLTSWLPNLQDVSDWFYDWWGNVGDVVSDWWDSVKYTVKGWIDIATQGLDTLIAAWDDFWSVTFPQWTNTLEGLASDISNFFTVTLPTLFDIGYVEQWWVGKFGEVTSSIETAFKEHEPFWAGWQEIYKQFASFFENPFDWIKLHVFEPIVDDFNRGFDRGLKGE